MQIRYQIFDSIYDRKEYQTQLLDTKCEVCGGTREALAIRRTLFYSVARPVEQFYLSRVISHQPPYPQTTRPHRKPFCTIPFRARAIRRDSRVLGADGQLQVP